MDAAELTEGLPRNEFDEPFVEVKTFALNLFGGACRLIPTGLSQTTVCPGLQPSLRSFAAHLLTGRGPH